MQPIYGVANLTKVYEHGSVSSGYLNAKNFTLRNALPVVTQAATLEELTANLREAIALQLEGETLADLGLVQGPAVFATLDLDGIADGKA